MTVIVKQSVSIRDNRGHVGRTGFHYFIQDDTTAAVLLNAYNASKTLAQYIAAASNGAIVAYNGLYSPLITPNNYGASSQFPNAEDKAVLVFLMGDAAVAPIETAFMKIEVPAPKLAVFEADQETVKPTAAAVSTIVTAVLTIDASSGFVSNKAGMLPLSFVAGYRVRRKFQRKITIWDKSSNLDEPEE